MRIYTPFLATLAVVMIVGSMISSNVAVVSASGFTIITAVLTLHSCGFAIGYFLSKALGLSDRIARTNSIEVRWGCGGRRGQRLTVHTPLLLTTATACLRLDRNKVAVLLFCCCCRSVCKTLHSQQS
jgi:hypothetical protein